MADSTGWMHLTSASPFTQGGLGLDISGSGFVVATFGNGVWRYEDTTGWMQLTTTPSVQVRIDDNGNVVGEDLSGVWRYEDATGIQQLTSAIALEVGVSSSTDTGTVVGMFGANYGFWVWKDSTGWQQLTNATTFLYSFA